MKPHFRQVNITGFLCWGIWPTLYDAKLPKAKPEVIIGHWKSATAVCPWLWPRK